MIADTTRHTQRDAARRTLITAQALRGLAHVCFAATLVFGLGAASAEDDPDRAAANSPAKLAAHTDAAEAPVKRAVAVLRGPKVVPADGCGSPGALGVSRVQEIDADTGPKYGHQQHDAADFLNDHEVVLTFDDGPLRPYTMPVLKALDAHCTKATFFIVGQMAAADPALVRETAKRGHTLGSHTWSHKDLRKTGPSRGKGELELGLSGVSKVLGTPAAPFFRFPYLSAPAGILSYAVARKIAVFSIDVDSRDYRTKDPAVVRRNVLAGLQETGKGIILFHDIQPSTAGALKGLLDELKARGFNVVHLVPKQPATTLPEYDAMAERELARKSQSAANDPLASRSIVWPVTGTKPGARAAAGGPVPDGDTEVLPWGTTAVTHEPIVPEPKRRAPPLQPKQDDDWFAKLFKN